MIQVSWILLTIRALAFAFASSFQLTRFTIDGFLLIPVVDVEPLPAAVAPDKRAILWCHHLSVFTSSFIEHVDWLIVTVDRRHSLHLDARL